MHLTCDRHGSLRGNTLSTKLSSENRWWQETRWGSLKLLLPVGCRKEMPTYHMAAEEDNELGLLKLTNVKLTDAQNAMTRTILRSVVRVQSLARGNLSFYYYYYYYFLVMSFSLLITSIWFLFMSTHIIFYKIYFVLLLKMSNWGNAVVHNFL